MKNNIIEIDNKTTEKEITNNDKNIVATNVKNIWEAINNEEPYEIIHIQQIRHSKCYIPQFYCIHCHKELDIIYTPKLKSKYIFRHREETCREEIEKEKKQKKYKTNLNETIDFHRMAINCFKNSTFFNIPDSYSITNNNKIWKNCIFKYEKVEIEQKISDIIPDIILTNKDGFKILIEISYSHPISQEKQHKIENGIINLPTIQIDISSLKKDYINLKKKTKNHYAIYYMNIV